MSKRTPRRSNPWKLLFLVAIIVGIVYLNYIVVPTIASPFAVTPTPTRSPESFINEAEAYFTQGKMTQAIDAYKEAILADPQNPANFIALARVQIFAGQYNEAKINAENALLLNPDNANAYAMRAWALDSLGDYLEALAAVKKAIELDPTNALAYAFYAEILIDQGNYEDIETAISMSHKARDLAPNNLETHRARGYVLYATGNYAEAIEEYKAAIAINDKLWDMHYSLGVAYKLTEDYDLAVQEMLTAVALNPTNPDILTEISRTHATIGQFDKAIQYAEQALLIDSSNPRLHGNLGVMLYKGEEYDRAVDEFVLAVRGGTTADGVAVQGLPLAPGRVADEYYTFYGWSLLRLRRCDEAVEIFYFIIQNIQDDQLAYYNATEGISFCQDSFEDAAP